MSLATRFEQAIREREAARDEHTRLLAAIYDGKGGMGPVFEAARRYEAAYQAGISIMDANESAILAALKFTEAFGKTVSCLSETLDDGWCASDWNGHAAAGDTPAAAVASLVAELEKK